MSGSGITEARLYIEYLGIGYWFCGFAILMVLRSTRNGLWRPNFSRRWATLSFSFWLPMVMLLVTVHQGAGVIQHHFDRKEFKKLWGSSYKTVFDDKELKERVTFNGPGMANAAYMELIREKKREDSGQRRLCGTAIMDDFMSKSKAYMSGIWLSLHGLLIVSIIQLFRLRIRGTVTLVNSGLLLAFTISLAVFVFFYVDLIRPRVESNVEISVGYGCYLAFLAALGMVSEQFIFWSKRNEKGVIGKSEEMIDDVV